MNKLPHEYNEIRSWRDAEYLLENLLCRNNWTTKLRNDLAFKLRFIVGREMELEKLRNDKDKAS